MRTRSRAALLAAALAVAGVDASGCSKLNCFKGQMAFKDANAAYQRQRLQKGDRQVPGGARLQPRTCQVAYFYLANSYDNLYKPAKKGQPENDAYLHKAVENYKKASETIADPKLKKLSLRVSGLLPTAATS